MVWKVVARTLGCLAILVMAIGSSGCPLLEFTEHGVLFMYSMTDNAGSSVDTLQITIDQVSVIQGGNEVILRDQPFVVDMRRTVSTPVGMGFALAAPGVYNSIKLRISAVKLVFASDTDTEHTEVILTNGNPITLNGTIPLEGTLQTTIHVMFNSLEVDETGPEITMQPQALVTQQPVDAQTGGNIGAVLEQQNEFYLPTYGGNFHVDYSNAAIYLPSDDDGDPTGDEGDLTSGRGVIVRGSFQPWGDVAATRIDLQ